MFDLPGMGGSSRPDNFDKVTLSEVQNKIDKNDIASHEKLMSFLSHLDKVLKNINFIKDDRPMISRKINYIFKKSGLSEEEINILRGFLSAIENHSQ